MKTRLCIVSLLLVCSISGQSKYPQNYFRSPVDIAIELAGNFGELRENHFHSGIDITTHGQEDLNVYAAADGYVSRIKVGPWGYGKVVYITHPNGYVTVYGHLKNFNDVISDYVGKEQARNETYEAEVFLKAGEIVVKKGDIIAYSGNTGSSGGPHLHFEIRDEKTEDAINPLMFGLPVKDKVSPTPYRIMICPAEPDAVINGKHSAQKFTLVKSGSKYILKDSVSIFGKVGFAIDAYDKEDLPNGKNGVYSVQLDKNGRIIYKHHIERMPFDRSRYINCHIDYKEYEKTKIFFQRSFVLPNDQLPIYDTLVNDGYVRFNTDSSVRFRYTIGDVFGNSGIAEFRVRSLRSAPANADKPAPAKPFDMVLVWGAPNKIEESLFVLESDAGAFYQNEQLNYTLTSTREGAFQSVAFDPYIPIQKACTLTLFMKPDPAKSSKMIMVMKDKAGKVSPVGGAWNDEGIYAEIKEFGTFFVMTDTTAPTVKTSNFDLKGLQKDLSSLKTLNFTIGDNLSGIKTYHGTIDGKWVLFQYEPKKKLIWYTFDKTIAKGEHSLVLEVTDKCGNKTTYTKQFSR